MFYTESILMPIFKLKFCLARGLQILNMNVDPRFRLAQVKLKHLSNILYSGTVSDLANDLRSLLPWSPV